MEKKQTLKHLAKMSGMSLSSVSRALDPARRHLVRPATREKILKYAKEVNFSVNMPARQLRRKQSEVITVVVFQLPNKNKNFSNEFVSPSNGRDIIQKLSYFIKAKNYDMKLEFIAEGEMIPDSNMIFDLNRTDGIIFVGYHGTEYIDIIKKNRMPNIYMSNYIDIKRSDVNYIGLNREPGYRQAIECLLKNGRTRFAWMSPPVQASIPVKMNIVYNLFHEYSIYNEKLFFKNICSYYDIQRLVSDFCNNRFDVIFCSNDVIADWVVRELRVRNIKVPAEVAVIGYDNDPDYHGNNTNNVATIDAPPGLMAETTIANLFTMINNHDTDTTSQTVLDTIFLKGETI